MTTTQFDHIYRGSGLLEGKLRLAPGGLGWKEQTENGQPQVVTVAKDDIKWAQWVRVARRFQLRIGLNKDRSDTKTGDRRRESFEGFKSEEHDQLVNLFKQHYNIVIEDKDISFRGWNWGKVDVQASDLVFQVAGRTAFELPLSHIVGSTCAKAEVTLEVSDVLGADPNQDGSAGSAKAKARRAQTDQLCEVRMYVPGTASKGDDDDNEGSDADASDIDPEAASAAQVLSDLIKEKGDIGQVSGEGIVTFPEVLCTTPRGRYDIDMYASFLRLRGKTYDYKVLYASIQRLFLLPKPDDIHFNFVVQLDPPIRQGQTRYPFLVMQFARDEEMDAELNLDAETLQASFQQEGNKIEGQAHEVVSIVFKGLAKKKIVFPQNFQSVSGQTAIKCNMKANEGLLYFLDKYILFISKQPILIAMSDIHLAKFARVGGALQSSRTFDLVVTKKDETELQFSSLSREEHPVIEEYFKNKDKKVENEMMDEVGATGAAVAALLEDEDDEDEEMADPSSEEGGGRKRTKKTLGAPANVGDGDDDDESDDESFSGGSGSSDVAEEFDSNYSGSASDSDDGMGADKPAKKGTKNSSDERPAKKQKKS